MQFRGLIALSMCLFWNYEPPKYQNICKKWLFLEQTTLKYIGKKYEKLLPSLTQVKHHLKWQFQRFCHIVEQEDHRPPLLSLLILSPWPFHMKIMSEMTTRPFYVTAVRLGIIFLVQVSHVVNMMSYLTSQRTFTVTASLLPHQIAVYSEYVAIERGQMVV